MTINTRLPGDCLYRATRKGTSVEVYANSQMKACERACKHFGVKTQRKQEVTVLLIERADGSPAVRS